MEHYQHQSRIELSPIGYSWPALRYKIDPIPHFAAASWRTFQNYVGRTLAPGMEEIHLVPPIAAAALVAWSFVYFHPFEDGNGRIHRFLIHHLLAARRLRAFRRALAGFSRPA